MKLLRFSFTILFCFLIAQAICQDSLYLKVHFLYGSVPKKKYKDTEKKWFGGKLGGHVGIESDPERIVNFVPRGKAHIFQKKKAPASYFAIHASPAFYSILGGEADSAKKAIVYIPITALQKHQFDSITAGYLSQTPYDYAVFGMRCGAAAYDLLSQLDIFPKHSNGRVYKKIFYPKKLRKRLFKKAKQNNWTVVRKDGTERRKWERD